MFLLSDVYFSSVEGARVVLFYGRVGSYKTLQAVATAYALLKTGRYARCYANIPVTFATSPPEDVTKFDFMDERYSKDSIFIIDESALFLSGQHQQIKEIFAFPRKLNQVFLLASVLPTKQIRDYCHLFVHRNYNLSMIGLPLMTFLSSEEQKVNRKEKVSHMIFGYSRYFRKYSSKFRPDGMVPIDQWRDRAALYDSRSRKIPIQIVKYYVVNSWGYGERKKKLTEDEETLCNSYIPEYNLEYLNDENLDLPQLKQKKGFNLLGSEFKGGFFFQLMVIFYVAYVAIFFFGNTRTDDPPVTQWTLAQWGYFWQGKPVQVQYHKNHVEAKQSTQTTPTPQVVEFTQE